jgi:hypothetical protein|tara:strand:+ start:229 stop:447 length:219 start_codon:yes stop_codon:yes gene_type:complete
MATNEDVLEHLEALKNSVNYAINTVVDWQRFGAKMTNANKATELAKVTTIPSARQHASNCTTCVGWDGSIGT